MQITEGDINSFVNASSVEMEKVLKFFEKDLVSLRTGRASTALIENILVDAYGQTVKLREVAALSAPDPRLLVIQPWDKSLLNSIQKGIMVSDLGINPAVDGEIIRLQLPMMSSERREEFVKVLAKKTEEAKTQIRNVRKDFHNKIRDAKEDKAASEDFLKRLEEALQKNTDAWIEKIIAVGKKKEAELRAV